MVPKGWKIGTINDIAQVSSGGTPSRDNDSYWKNGYIPWVTTAEVKFGVINDTEQKITDAGLNNSSAKLFPEDTILMAMYGQGKTRGQVAKLGIKASTNQACAAIQLKSKFNVDFYYQYLISQYENVRNLANSGGQKNLSGTIIKEIVVPIPPLAEQQKIAKILSTWDNAISTTERLIDNSQQQKKALMQQLLTGKQRLLDDSGERFSGEWEEVALKDCAKSLDNLRVPLNSSQRQSMVGGIPYWGANGIVGYVNDYIFDSTIVLLAEDGGYFDEFASRPIANISYGKAWVNNHAHVLTAKENTINEWLYFSLVNKNILAFINGGTRAKLNKSDMLQIPIRLPSLQEQQKIITVLTNADREIELLQQQLADLQQEKKALMQQLLTGKRRVLADELY